VISHGRSSPRAIKNAIKRAHEFALGRVNEHLSEEIIKSSVVARAAVTAPGGAASGGGNAG